MAAKDSSDKQNSKNHSLADVRALARILRQYDLTQLEVEVNGARLALKRENFVGSALGTNREYVPVALERIGGLEAEGRVTSAAGGSREAQSSPEPGLVEIVSPFVGTFYRAPSPDSPPFVEAGQNVRKGQTLCIVEAMKLMNEIEAEMEAQIVEILPKNGEPVEYGQPLFRVLPL